MNLIQMAVSAREAAHSLAKLSSGKKNECIEACAVSLVKNSDYILNENAKDMANADANNMSLGLKDRLKLTKERIDGIADGLRVLISLDDPICEVTGMKKRPNGLLIGQVRVPLGVVGIIYESRPNVTADAFGLCFKTGNAVILKGGSDALYSNIAIVKVIKDTLKACGIDENAVSLITDTGREVTTEFMKLEGFLDVLIPRGGAGLIKAVVRNATVPVIETGSGNCHIYVDESADIDMAIDIIMNAKTQRVGVCNACESLVVHENIIGKLLPPLSIRLNEAGVEIRADEKALFYMPNALNASLEDFGTEYLDYIISVKTVSDIDEAISHINRYNTGHSEAIITKDYDNSQKFLNEVDAACVYVNASTRFTDGFEFGFGAEIGISTQKLHARGPMGLLALTTTKYIIYGNGQVRK